MHRRVGRLEQESSERLAGPRRATPTACAWSEIRTHIHNSQPNTALPTAPQRLHRNVSGRPLAAKRLCRSESSSFTEWELERYPSWSWLSLLPEHTAMSHYLLSTSTLFPAQSGSPSLTFAPLATRPVHPPHAHIGRGHEVVRQVVPGEWTFARCTWREEWTQQNQAFPLAGCITLGAYHPACGTNIPTAAPHAPGPHATPPGQLHRQPQQLLGVQLRRQAGAAQHAQRAQQRVQRQPDALHGGGLGLRSKGGVKLLISDPGHPGREARAPRCATATLSRR